MFWGFPGVKELGKPTGLYAARPCLTRREGDPHRRVRPLPGGSLGTDGCANICSHSCFHFLWVHAEKCISWAVW